MNIETTTLPTMALTKMLLNDKGKGPECDDDIERAREMLRNALAINQELPPSMPYEYFQQCDLEESQGGLLKGKDVVLDQKFVLVPQKLAPTCGLPSHPHLQRVYGHSGDYLVLEDLPKGMVSEYMRNAKGRLQLGAQRRITIMLEVAKVMQFLRKQASYMYHVSTFNIGLTLDLTPKLCRSSGEDDEHSDVYNFGIVMIELLVGTLNHDAGDRKFGDLGQRYLGKSLLEDDLDPYVRENWTFNILSQLIELALLCIKEEATPAKLVETLTLISARMSVVESYDYYM